MTFENKFFHSTVAYPTEQSFETFREKLLAAASDPKWPAATRAALGLMAATTVEPAHYPRTYEPFSDAWAPEVLLELKSNHGKLYGALTESKPAGEALHPAVRVIRERMIAERKAGVKSGAIVDPGALIAELNQVTTPLTAADAQIAARYLRFDYTALPKLDARTPWAKLAARYARLFEAGHYNDYEQLSAVLAELI